MGEFNFRADCSQCSGLCCVSHPFDRSSSFAIDKAAGEPCRHLGVDHRCTIHAELTQKGFSGCVAYDCLGAGQRITQDVFGGRSWRDHPDEAPEMFAAFLAMRQVHELLQLLQTAGNLPLTPPEAENRNMLLVELEPDDGWTMKSLSAFTRSDLSNQVKTYLKSLSAHVNAPE